MASGVKVDEEVIKTYQLMHIKKTDDDPRERPRIVTLVISEGYIVIDKIFKCRDLEDKGDVYNYFVKLFDEKCCFYCLYDCHYEKETPKEEIIFIMWAPECSKIKDKMKYSSSKQSLTSALKGIKHIMEIHCLAELLDEIDFTSRLGKGICKLEGHDVK